MKARTADRILLLIFVFCLCVVFMAIWNRWNDEEDVAEFIPTPQACADLYYSMPANLKSHFDNSEDYINQCVR